MGSLPPNLISSFLPLSLLPHLLHRKPRFYGTAVDAASPISATHACVRLANVPIAAVEITEAGGILGSTTGTRVIATWIRAAAARIGAAATPIGATAARIGAAAARIRAATARVIGVTRGSTASSHALHGFITGGGYRLSATKRRRIRTRKRRLTRNPATIVLATGQWIGAAGPLAATGAVRVTVIIGILAAGPRTGIFFTRSAVFSARIRAALAGFADTARTAFGATRIDSAIIGAAGDIVFRTFATTPVGLPAT